MLILNKNISLNGVSQIDGQPVVYMSANLSTDGTSSNNVNKSISNRELYNANKAQVRQDMADFENTVYQVEDELAKGELDETKQ